MTAAASTGLRTGSLADKVLKASGLLWYLTAVTGQGLFIWFIVSFYYGPTLTGHFEAWNRKDLITGYVAGDHTGNLFFAAHVIVAALVTASGALQLIPYIRQHLIVFHRWNGRFYILMGMLMALDGLWLVWVRGTYLTVWGLISSVLLGGLILGCAAMTLRNALRRRIDLHKKWAMRTFMVMNAVWFQRLGYMAGIILNHGPVGMGKRMDGPFDIVLGFAAYLVPLAVLEVYLRASDSGPAPAKVGVAIGLVVMTGVMGLGIFGAFAFMWRPFL